MSHVERVLQQLPALDTRLFMDPAALSRVQDELRPEELELAQLAVSMPSIGDAVLASGLPELKALERLAWLYGQGILCTKQPRAVSRPPDARNSSRPHSPPRTQLMFSVAPQPNLEPERHSEPPRNSESETPVFWPPLSSRRSPTGTIVSGLTPSNTSVAATATRAPERGLPAALPPRPVAQARSIKAQRMVSIGPPPELHAEAATESPERHLIELADLPEQPPLSDPGDSVELGRYEVLCRIGRGGMGSAYLCRMRGAWGFEQLFCLKVLREHLIVDPSAVDFFVREAKIASRLTHPNIVNIVDVGSFEHQPYIVMHYVEGASLAQLLASDPQVSPAIVVAVLLDALAGLSCAHEHVDSDGSALPFVHCDISPHNLLVGIDGSTRIADFGVAKAATVSIDDGGQPMRGKPAYASPEQLSGDTVDCRSDLFSLGAVFWSALTGEQLFGNEIRPDSLFLRRSAVRPPSEVGRRPPAVFDAICLKALAFDASERFQSAAEFLVALRKTAIMNDLVAAPQEVGQWVRRVAGVELEQRRRRAAKRGERETLATSIATGTTGSLAPPAGHTGSVAGALDATVSASELGVWRDQDASRTIVLPKKPSAEAAYDDEPPLSLRKRQFLAAAAGFTLVLIAIALFQPTRLRTLFRTEGPPSRVPEALMPLDTPSASPTAAELSGAQPGATQPPGAQVSAAQVSGQSLTPALDTALGNNAPAAVPTVAAPPEERP